MSEYNPFLDDDFRSSVIRYIRNNSGQVEDAEDVLSESYLIYHKSQNSGEVKVKQTVKQYAFGICRNLWMNQLRKRVFTVEEIREQIRDASDADGFVPVNDAVSFNREDWLSEKLKASGNNCKEILEGKANKKSSRELAKALNLNEDTINTRANQCRNKMRELLLEPLGEKAVALLKIFNPKRRKAWYTTEFQEKHTTKLIEMGYSSFEVARDAAITDFDKLFSFLFPNSVK